MKPTSTTLTKSVGKLTILFIIILGTSYMLYGYYQPLCEPCLHGTGCPPCKSKEQFMIMYLFGTIELIVLVRILYLNLIKSNKMSRISRTLK